MILPPLFRAELRIGHLSLQELDGGGGNQVLFHFFPPRFPLHSVALNYIKQKPILQSLIFQMI